MPPALYSCCVAFHGLRKSSFSYIASTYVSFLMEDSSQEGRIAEFITMLMRNSNCSQETIVYTCTLLRRVRHILGQPFSVKNIKRYFLAAVMVAFDLLNDETYTFDSWLIITNNSYDLQTLEIMQNMFLRILVWDTFVFLEDFGAIVRCFIHIFSLKNTSIRTIMTDFRPPALASGWGM